MSLTYNIGIGACLSRNDSSGTWDKIVCLEDRNFCCRVSNFSNFLSDTGKRSCCSYEQFSDQHWATMAAIQGFSILLAVMFMLVLIVSGWFYLTSCGISETEITEQRKKIIGQLLRRQILDRAHRNIPSVVGSLKQTSDSSSSSSHRKHHKSADTARHRSNKRGVRWSPMSNQVRMISH